MIVGNNRLTENNEYCQALLLLHNIYCLLLADDYQWGLILAPSEE